MTEAEKQAASSRLRRWATGRPPKVAIAAVAVLAVGGGALAAAGGAATEHRTVTVARRTVVEGLELTGTVTSSGRADLSFGTSGTVAKVVAKVGAKVKKGQVIARLDRTSLRRDLTKAQAALDEAEAQLASDLEAQVTGVLVQSSGSSGQTAPASTSSTASSDGGVVTGLHVTSTSASSTHPVTTAPAAASAEVPAAVKEALEAVKAAQQQVVSAQGATSAALTTAEAALDVQRQACAAGVAEEACGTALTDVQTAQQAVATAQQGLQDAIASLTDALDAAIAAVQEAAASAPSGSGTPQTPGKDKAPDQGRTPDQGKGKTPGQSDGVPRGDQAPSPGGESGPSSSGGAGGPDGAVSGHKVTAATIASDQADVHQARADLLEARTAFREAVLKAPVGGLLRVLDLAEGDSVSSRDVVAVVVSDEVTAVDASADVTEVGALSEGQQVEVFLAGRAEPVQGSVTRVASAPTSGSTDYPVRVLLTDDAEDADGQAPLGSTAALTVVTSTREDVVAVPLSAVSGLTDGTGTVQVKGDDGVTTTRVTLGAVGATHAEVLEGLEDGDEVVLATLGGDAPTGAAGTVNESSGGGFPGGGFPGGGPNGGWNGGGRPGR